ncbi:conserved hypothetical protein [Talaromyces stipitatus ATCC 10500]|uniref:Uncharacterized protein n=1 Tax=Talaromyces stipitatus (strain ATCC 10500 / CBS 375.48 / QM 6759 / NRRL 1006) TaxID=441959 RepID=B8MT44_TALSN|nr:uncharacterized protein TSTA_003100 [Talaromyces stipitatus ATCC 10500]EED12247.1 conserved hypothetical protein [Talaromyces stipitatus ATCC 10500]
MHSNALSLAAAGVGYGWIAHEMHSWDALYRGRSLYCSALSSAQRLISSSEYTDELLPIMMMLLLYELFEFGTQSSTGWETHASGIEAALQLYGSQMLTSPLAYQLFYFYRTIGVLRSLILRKSTFLSKAEWIEAPWSSRPKNSYHKFLDLAAEVPDLLEQIDSISTGDSLEQHGNLSPERLLRRILNIIHRMKEWERFSGPHLALGPPHRLSSSGTSMTLTDRLQPRAHRYPTRNTCVNGTDFDKLQSARLMLFHWAVMLTLYTSLYGNSHLFRFSEYENNNENSHLLSMHDLEFAAENLAYKVALWADFCCQNAWQSFGPAIGIFSVKAAMKWYEVRLRAYSSGISHSLAQQQLQKCQTLLAHLTYCDRNREFTIPAS